MGSQTKCILFHNPRCGKSRTALSAIQQTTAKVEVVEYLQENPTKDQLNKIIQKIGCNPHDLIRTKEKVYQENFKGKTFSEEEWLEIMVKHPILIERPIAIFDNKAIIVRTPEAITEMLSCI
jgi:arsenate reductase